MYLKEFEIRWNDLDANRHLANSTYLNYMSHTRLSFFNEKGFDQSNMIKHNIGPVVFKEHIFYFNEIFPGEIIRVSLLLKGLSEGGMYFEFHHNFYNSHGKNMARCVMMGAWIDLKTRKLRDLPEALLLAYNQLEKTEDFKILTKKDTRVDRKFPINLK